MGDLVSLSRPCEYFVARASKHRRAGRYDAAMTLLARAKEQFGIHEEIELEMACVYDAMSCEEEAARSYLRVVRLAGRNKALALFHLTLSSLQHGDVRRAVSYYQHFCSTEDRSGISEEMAALLGRQLSEDMRKPASMSRSARAKLLERRVIEKMHAGKSIAAKRAAEHAAALYPNAQRYTLLACCCLLCGYPHNAVDAAAHALAIKPGRIQTRCVLIDALYACSEHVRARNALFLTAMRAKKEEDLLLVALESAKYGEDQLTLRLTRQMLKREPFQIRAMMLRACALANLGRLREASRLFGRLCVLLPENTICEAYYKMARDGIRPIERLELRLDVTRQESLRRVAEVMQCLMDARTQRLPDHERQRELCRLCGWALESSMAGAQAKTAALVLLRAMDCAQAKEILLDCLTDAQMDDQFKMAVLRMLAPDSGFDTYWMDFEGKLVRVAAGSTAGQGKHNENAEEDDDELH